MKRLRTGGNDDEQASTVSVAEIARILPGLTRDERTALSRILQDTHATECATVMAMLPDEVWCNILWHADEDRTSVFRFTLVCQRWKALVDILILARYGNFKLSDGRILRRFTQLETLSLMLNRSICNRDLTRLTALTNLDLEFNTIISNQGLNGLTALRELSLSRNYRITEEALLPLADTLEALDLCRNSQITDNCLSRLTNLTWLSLAGNNTVTDQALTCLQRLHTLYLDNNETITELALTSLENLTSLSLDMTPRCGIHTCLPRLTGLVRLSWGSPSEYAPLFLRCLPNLRALHLYCAPLVTGDHLSCLTGLEELRVSTPIAIDDHHIRWLTNLRALRLNDNETITADGIRTLPNLTQLRLGYNSCVTADMMASMNITLMEDSKCTFPDYQLL